MPTPTEELFKALHAGNREAAFRALKAGAALHDISNQYNKYGYPPDKNHPACPLLAINMAVAHNVPFLKELLDSPYFNEEEINSKTKWPGPASNTPLLFHAIEAGNSITLRTLIEHPKVTVPGEDIERLYKASLRSTSVQVVYPLIKPDLSPDQLLIDVLKHSGRYGSNDVLFNISYALEQGASPAAKSYNINSIEALLLNQHLNYQEINNFIDFLSKRMSQEQRTEISEKLNKPIDMGVTCRGCFHLHMLLALRKDLGFEGYTRDKEDDVSDDAARKFVAEKLRKTFDLRIPEHKWPSDHSALATAAQNAGYHAYYVAYLIEEGADVNEKIFGKTPIMEAGSANAALVLMHRGADLVVEHEGVPALFHMARNIKRGSESDLHSLASAIATKHGEDVFGDIVDHEGNTIIHIQTPMLGAVLATREVDVNQLNHDGKTPLMAQLTAPCDDRKFSSTHKEEIAGHVRTLASWGADIFAQDYEGNLTMSYLLTAGITDKKDFKEATQFFFNSLSEDARNTATEVLETSGKEGLGELATRILRGEESDLNYDQQVAVLLRDPDVLHQSLTDIYRDFKGIARLDQDNNLELLCAEDAKTMMAPGAITPMAACRQFYGWFDLGNPEQAAEVVQMVKDRLDKTDLSPRDIEEIKTEINDVIQDLDSGWMESTWDNFEQESEEARNDTMLNYCLNKAGVTGSLVMLPDESRDELLTAIKQKIDEASYPIGSPDRTPGCSF